LNPYAAGIVRLNDADAGRYPAEVESRLARAWLLKHEIRGGLEWAFRYGGYTMVPAARKETQRETTAAR